ncbi:MAG: DUF1543 domain-containing protein [Gammaproteobacteria bacterium]|nr:DUF1543 domain-containing protein [Gammaproteobacteria bacterium]
MDPEPALYLVYVGGRAPKANIELHDVLFVAGASIEDTYPALRNAWFGNPESLHLDTYMRVQNIDGYQIHLRPEPPKHKEKLFFINLGGYESGNLAELHEFGLFVATSSGKAKTRAKEKLLVGSESQHKDDLFEIDDCFAVAEVDQYFVHLDRKGAAQPQTPDWFGYNPIGNPR